MAQFPCFPLWTDAWIADTKHLTRCERGSYLDLLILMWRTPGCSVPNDDAWLGKRLSMTSEEIQNELRPIISEFCQSDGNRIFQKRLKHEFSKAGIRARAASVSSSSRWSNKVADKSTVFVNPLPDNEKDPCVGNASLNLNLNTEERGGARARARAPAFRKLSIKEQQREETADALRQLHEFAHSDPNDETASSKFGGTIIEFVPNAKFA